MKTLIALFALAAFSTSAIASDYPIGGNAPDRGSLNGNGTGGERGGNDGSSAGGYQGR